MTGSVFVILGPTASGKTKLSIALAKHYKADIISLDSIQTYKDAAILSAKPLPQEQNGVKHHMIDYLQACDEPSLYVQQVISKITAISRQNNIIICGGSISLCLPLLLRPEIQSLRPCFVVLRCSQPLINKRIRLRIDQMFEAGLTAELEHLWALEQRHGPSASEDCASGVWKAIGYKSFRPWVAQEHRTTDDTLFRHGIADFQQETENYAARQINHLNTQVMPALLNAAFNINILEIPADESAWPLLMETVQCICALHSQHPRAAVTAQYVVRSRI